MIAAKTLIFTIFVPGSVTILIPYLLLSSDIEPFSLEFGSVRIAGILPIALGAVFYLWCAWDFSFSGKGTPAPFDPPKIFVSRGLYRMARNPMYVGITLMLIGESIAFESAILLIYAVLLWISFHLFVIYYEEPTLKKKFGPTYEVYCLTVPRWIPSVIRVKRTR